MTLHNFGARRGRDSGTLSKPRASSETSERGVIDNFPHGHLQISPWEPRSQGPTGMEPTFQYYSQAGILL